MSFFDIEKLNDDLEENPWDERPVRPEVFLYEKDFMNLRDDGVRLSDEQFKLFRVMTQIFNLDTLIDLYGEEYGPERFRDSYKEIIACLGKGCHAPYTPIFNPDTGTWVRIDSITTDGNVISYDGKSHYATESFQEGYGKMVRVRTALGLEEDVYVGHKYLSYAKSKFYHRYSGIEPLMQTINKLSIGDRIAIGINFDVNEPVNIPLEYAELAGYWLGDGMLPTDKNPIINMDFCSDEVEGIARYEELCVSIGDSPTKTVHKTKNLTFFRHGTKSKAVVIARELGLWGMRSKDKEITDVIWASDNSIIAAVISKLWQTDGCVYSKNGTTAEFVSVSKKLAEGVQKGLLRLGVPSSIRFRTPKSNFANAAEAGYVTVSSDECINAFFSIIQLLDHKNIVPAPKSGRVYNRIDGNIYYDRIVSIEEIGDGPYWTRTVPDTGNYVGNGMVSANSGKDYVSTLACAYVVYQLLCLKDPSKFFGRPSHDAIDLINIAINADQAKRVFFNGFKRIIEKCQWFAGKYSLTANQFEFDKFVNVYSGHSEREAFEGLNLIFAVLDEIAGFSTENTSGREDGGKTADAVYKMYKASISSRYSEQGKLVLLSFPRYKDDFIDSKYKAAYSPVDFESMRMTHMFTLNEELPEGTEGNEFTIEWDHDIIANYKSKGVFAIRRATWEVNPLKSIDDYVDDFFTDPLDAIGRVAAQPPDAVSGYFRNHEKVDNFSSGSNHVNAETGDWMEWAAPEAGEEYFIHIDLAIKHDNCVLSMAHVTKWAKRNIGTNMTDALPWFKVDLVRIWKPGQSRSVDFSDVKAFITEILQKGYNVKQVTLDRWRSEEMLVWLEDQGVKSAVQSVLLPQYQDLLGVINEERAIAPHIDLMRKEFKQLRLVGDRNAKIDHPRSGSKDIADAVCGSIYGAMVHTKRGWDGEVEVYTAEDLRKMNSDAMVDQQEELKRPANKAPGNAEMPQDLSDFFSAMKLL